MYQSNQDIAPTALLNVPVQVGNCPLIFSSRFRISSCFITPKTLASTSPSRKWLLWISFKSLICALLVGIAGLTDCSWKVFEA
jgi:hypothetical protein